MRRLANEIVDDVAAEFGGEGGGGSTFQDGGLDEEPATVVEYVRNQA